MSFLIFFNQNHASKIRHSITFDIGDNVTISYNGSNITDGQVIKVDDKSKFEAQISVPDKYIPSVSGATLSGNRITIDQVTQDTTIKATATAPCNITISTDEYTHVIDSNNNTIAAAGSTTTIKIPYGDPFNANIVRKENYEANDQYGDSISIQSVTQDYTFELKSKIIEYKIYLSTDNHSIIKQGDSIIVDKDSFKTITLGKGLSFNATIIRDEHYIANTELESDLIINNTINIINIDSDYTIYVRSTIEKKIVSITLDDNLEFKSTISYDSGMTHNIEVDYGSRFFGTIMPKSGYEIDVNNSSTSYLSGNNIDIESVTDNITMSFVSKLLQVTHQVNVYANTLGTTIEYDRQKAIYGTASNVVSGSVNDGEDFGPATISFSDGYEYDSYTATDGSTVEISNGQLIVKNVTKQTDVWVNSKQIEVAPSRYTVTINKSGSASDKITYTAPSSFGEDEAVNIMIDVPVGYEITSVTSNDVSISPSEIEKNSLLVGKNNHAAYSGVPNKNITINVAAEPAVFNINFNITNEWADCSEVKFTDFKSTYTSGDNATSLTYNGTISQYFKINDNENHFSISNPNGQTNNAKISNINSPGSRDGESNFTVTIIPEGHVGYLVGNLDINLEVIGTQLIYTWNFDNGAIGSTNAQFKDAIIEGIGEKYATCAEKYSAVTAFVHRDYKVTGWSVVDSNGNKIEDSGFGPIPISNPPLTLNDWSDAANAGYTSTWTFDRYGWDNYHYTLTLTQREKYNIQSSGENYSYKLYEKKWDGEWVETTESALREYVEWNNTPYGDNDGIYKLIVEANSSYAIETANISGVNLIDENWSNEQSFENYGSLFRTYTCEFKATGNFNIVVETKPWNYTQGILTIVNKYGDSAITVDMNSDNTAMRALKNAEYDNEAPRLYMYFDNNCYDENGLINSSGYITEDGSKQFDFAMTCPPYVYSSYAQTDINDSGFNYIAIQPNVGEGNYYSARIKTMNNAVWSDWSESSSPVPSGERFILSTSSEFSINQEDFKFEVELTIYSQEYINNADHLSIVDNTGIVNCSANKYFWKRDTISDADDYSHLILSYAANWNGETNAIKVTVCSSLNDGEDEILNESYIWCDNVGYLETAGIQGDTLYIPSSTCPSYEAGRTKNIGNITISFDRVDQ